MSQLGSEKIEQNKTSDCKEKKEMSDQSNKDASKDKRPGEESQTNKAEMRKIDESKKAGPSEPKLASAAVTGSFNGSDTVSMPANKKVSQFQETDKRTTDSDSVLNPNNGKTDNPLPVQRETPSSLSSANNNHTSNSGTNSFNGSRKSESAAGESRNHSYEHRRSNPENLSKTNLYIRGLPPNTKDDDLYTMCARFGDILSTKAILDKANGCCRGYGFVQYAAAQSAEVAVVELTKGGIQAQMARIPANHMSHSQRYPYHKGSNNNSHYQGHYQHHSGHPNQHGGTHHVSMNQAHNQSPHNSVNTNISDPTNLYLANLPLNMSEVELDLLLSSYGPVVSTRILRDERQNSRGVGFARMESRDKCQEIIEKLNGKSYKDSRELLLVKFADDGGRKRHNHSYNHQNSSNNHHLSHHQQHHHAGNNSHHKQSASEDDNRWREEGEGTDHNSNPSLYEHQRNLTHVDQMSDMSMMNPISYTRMQPTFPPAMAANAAYQPGLGPPTTQAQWLLPGPGQTWNVIPQHLVQPNNMNPSNQGAVPPNYPYGHMSQLASQMQSLHLGHHTGAPMAGYLPPQWSPGWPHPMSPPQQGQSQQMRLGAPAAQTQQIPPAISEATPPFISSQEGTSVNASKHTRLSDTNRPIPAPL